MIDIPALIEENRGGRAVGLPCFCTANEHVLRSILEGAATSGFPTVIEATCNQVNQHGGYTGMTPEAFIAWIDELARDARVPMDRLVLGGDHLGPNPWRKEDPSSAMDKARELVRRYAAAGFRKLHLDASMPCGGEPPLSFAQVAERAAELCAVAEAHAPDPTLLVYVIGTEVPVPGGETEEPEALDITSVDRLHDTIETHREAFSGRGLDAAWSRIVSLVTQPGVDFSHTSVHEFEPDAAAPLRDAIGAAPGLSFEAHSTDYQPTEALRALVANRFFFLKVGPELTFRFREAVLALADMEGWVVERPSRLRETLAERMEANPEHWADYYRGDPARLRMLKLLSYSDRVRYYWNDPEVANALERLLHNLSGGRLTDTVVSQYLQGVEFGEIPTDPREIVRRRVQSSVNRYFDACGYRTEEERLR